MELVVDWNAVCLVCLQEGEMRSIYDKDVDDKDLTISQKIIHCTNIEIGKGMNLPEQICSNCYGDLKIAYTFRTKCERSCAILKSFINIEVPNPNGQTYKFKPPSGLNVKRIKVAPRFEIKEENDEIEYQSDNDNDITHGIDDHITDEENQDYIEEDDDKKPFETVQSIDSRTSHSEKTDRKHVKKENKSIVETEKPVIKAKRGRPSLKTVPANKKIASKMSKTVGRRGRGRPKTKTEKTPPGVEITPDNVSSMVSKLTSVAYIRKKRTENKPLKICEICGNGYKFQHALDSHMRRHRNEKPFSCEFCDRAFVANVELRRHMRVHTGQKPYSCHYCQRSFSDFGSRIKHERTHTGERPYKCTTCGKAFAYAHVLSVHQLTHTGEKKFKCDVCGKGFTKKSYLQGHMKNHQKNESRLHEIQIIEEKIDINELTDKSKYIEIMEDKKLSENEEIIISKVEYIDDDESY